jgi:hypothetical protein
METRGIDFFGLADREEQSVGLLAGLRLQLLPLSRPWRDDARGIPRNNKPTFANAGRR